MAACCCNTIRPRRPRPSSSNDAVITPDTVDAQPDPVDLSLFHHRFMQSRSAWASLRQTSRSVNIRELDFSCALFDARGALVANAPHIPVHLGSMGDAVADLLEQFGAVNVRPWWLATP